ncbi:MAG: hypothetical protein WED34_07470 [Planctomycetales bacterium]
MKDDPIVASVRRAREDLAAKFDYDVHADLRSRESQLGNRLVRHPERRGKAMDASGSGPVPGNERATPTKV